MRLGMAHLIGLAGTLLVITGIGVWSGRRVSSAEDFSTGGSQAGTTIVIGSLMGTLVGGASTIGTAQLAFTNGFEIIRGHIRQVGKKTVKGGTGA